MPFDIHLSDAVVKDFRQLESTTEAESLPVVRVSKYFLADGC